ncbi:MAG: peptidase and matrixin and adamalysin, partial [Frankiales bacterium]|nr:peptidase and matrixin and adamalysin [Frankiales bacterium]
VATAGALAVRRVQAAAVGEVLAVGADAPASAGWGPTYVDEQGRPARWDPCRPISYVVQSGWAPDAGRADLAEALRRVSAASGLRFVDEGDTDELPSGERPAYQPERYGQRWAPLLIGWVPVGATDLALGNGVQGTSLAVAVPGRDGASLVSGQVVLDATNRLSPGFGPGTTDGEVLLHELAHAVGLGHVLDPTQVMYPQTTSSESVFDAGDRAGLAAVGAPAGCLPAPDARALRLSQE